jgi:hypothetical protein
MSTSGDTSSIEIPVHLPIIEDEIFVESDVDNPLHITYDFTKKNPMPVIEYETDIENKDRVFKPKKSFLRYVRNSKRRKS